MASKTTFSCDRLGCKTEPSDKLGLVAVSLQGRSWDLCHECQTELLSFLVAPKLDTSADAKTVEVVTDPKLVEATAKPNG